LANAGSSMAARMAMMAMTTNNSISVKAVFRFRQFFIFMLLNELADTGVSGAGQRDVGLKQHRQPFYWAMTL
jgi:hypothetical protein